MDFYLAIVSGIFCGLMLGCATAAAVWLVAAVWDYLEERP
jgi:hypothetical protein